MFLSMSSKAIRSREQYAKQKLSEYNDTTPLLVIKKRISRLRNSTIKQEQLESMLFSHSMDCIIQDLK